MIEDVVIIIYSWRYAIDFLILKTKSNLGGNPLILGRSWLATIDAFIGCRPRSMMIFDGQAIKNIRLYPPEKPDTTSGKPLWNEFEPKSNHSQPLLMLEKAKYLKDETKDDIISGFISNSIFVTSIENSRGRML